MNPERYQQIKTIFFAAMEKSDAERDALLESRCGADRDLRREVVRLLDSDGVETVDFTVTPAPAVPRRLGGCAMGEEIGRGGMGVVYAARDESTGETVAVKVVHPWLLLSPKAIERFSREARAGRRVDSEHVVRTLDVGEEGGVHFLVMEYEEGKSLRQLMDELGRVPEALCRRIAEQVALGLEAVHTAGFIHRDLKPENVLITTDQQIRIMDLGVAKLAEASLDLTEKGQFVGSVAYAAPEQFEEGEVGPASDLYGLGVVLMELVTGENPFRGETLAEMAHAHVNTPPPPVPDVSPFFAAVLSTLLAKRPVERIASAGDLARILAAGEAGGWWAERSRAVRTGGRPRVPVHRETKVRGRGDDLAALRESFQAAREGRGSALLLTGEPGLGKSRLVDEFLREVEGEAQILYGAYPVTGGMGGLIDAVTGRFGAARVSDALGSYLTETPGLVPGLAAFLRRETDAPRMARDALQAACAELLAGLSAERPTIWVTEDLHFAPDVGRAVALTLARAAPDRRALVLLTSREDLFPGQVPSRELHRLDADEVADLVRAVDPDATVAMIHRIARKSEGVPWFVFELLRTLKAAGDLTEVPSAVRDVLTVRLTDLAKEERALLDVAAAIGVEFDADLAAAALDVPVVTVLQDLAELERRTGVVRAAGRHYRFDHHQIRDLVHAELPVRLREEYHTRLARAGAERGESDRFVAYHHFAGRSPEEGMPALRAALDSAQMRYLHEEVLDLLARALDGPHELSSGDRAALVRVRADRLHYLGRREEQDAATIEAVELAEADGDPVLRANALLARGAILVSFGREEDALAKYRTAVTAAEEADDASLALTAKSRCGVVLARLRRDVEALELHRANREAARERDDVANVLLSTTNIAVALRHLGRYEEARDELDSILTYGDDSAYEFTMSHVFGNLGMVLWHLGDLERSREMLTRQFDVARRMGYRRTELAAVGNVGLVHRDLGDPGRALECFERHESFAREIGERRAELVACSNLGRMAAEFGDFDRARKLLERVRDEGESVGAPHMRPNAITALAEIAYLAGDDVEAKRLAAEAVRAFEGIEDPAGLAEALVALGNWERALPLLEQLGMPGFLLVALARSGDRAGAEALLAAEGARVGVPLRLEANHELWRRTGERVFLEEARRLLDIELANTPEEHREAVTTRVPRNAEILDPGGTGIRTPPAEDGSPPAGRSSSGPSSHG
ncbi:MAG: protein kinase [Planctomycetota bacterium]